MKKIIFALMLTASVSVSFAQEQKVHVKKEKLYINDSAICIIDKKKKGFLDIPSFELRALDDKPLGYVKYLNTIAPISGSLTWYRFSFEGVQDSVLLTMPDFRNFNKSTFIQMDEAIGKIIAEYSLVKNGQLNPDGIKSFKNDYGNDYSKINYAKVEKEKQCLVLLKTATLKTDASKPVTIELISTKEISKYSAVLEYEFKQDGALIGKLTAKGNAKGAKKDDAEWDYSPGLLDLDGGSPMSYEIYNADDCLVATYNGEERTLTTLKDAAAVKMGDIKKFNKDGVKSRLAYVQAMANLLVTRRYL